MGVDREKVYPQIRRIPGSRQRSRSAHACLTLGRGNTPSRRIKSIHGETAHLPRWRGSGVLRQTSELCASWHSSPEGKLKRSLSASDDIESIKSGRWVSQYNFLFEPLLNAWD